MARVRCGCSGGAAADYQDKMYGAGIRIANDCKNGDAFRCSVCGKEHGGGFSGRKGKKR